MHNADNRCFVRRQFLAVFLPSLVDEADFATDFLLLYRQKEEIKNPAPADEPVSPALLHPAHKNKPWETTTV